MSFEFLLLAIALSAAPGPGVLFTVSTGITQGARAGILAAIGCSIGVLPHFVLALSPAATVLQDNEAAFQIIKWLGVAYLVFLAYTMWRRGTHGIERREVQHPWRILGGGALINLLNPKVVLFFLVFMPRYAEGNDAVLGLIFIVIVFGVLALYGSLASRLGERMARRPRSIVWTQRVFASIILLAAVRLGFATN